LGDNPVLIVEIIHIRFGVNDKHTRVYVDILLLDLAQTDDDPEHAHMFVLDDDLMVVRRGDDGVKFIRRPRSIGERTLEGFETSPLPFSES